MKIPKELKVRDAVIETQRLKMNQMAFQIQLLSRSSPRNMSNKVFYNNENRPLMKRVLPGISQVDNRPGKLVPSGPLLGTL